MAKVKKHKLSAKRAAILKAKLKLYSHRKVKHFSKKAKAALRAAGKWGQTAVKRPGALTRVMLKTGLTKEQLLHSDNPQWRRMAQFAVNIRKNK